MSQILHSIAGAILATYNFFVGDAIILVAVLVAFLVGEILAHHFHVGNPLVAILFVGIIVAGLVATLGRELAGHRRPAG